MPVYQKNNISETTKIGVWKITETEAELTEAFVNIGLDKETFLQTKNEQRSKQWLTTRILLNEFFENVQISYDIYGKPQLSNNWHISISHSNEFVAINLNEKNHCGIDIEKISDKVARIKHKFLNDEDLKNVTSPEDLTIYWGAKEALYKCYGKKEVLFIENLFIEDYKENVNSFKGKIDMPDFKIEIQMAWENVDDYILVYTL